MDYTIYKDTKVEDTVNKIKSILDELDMKIEEVIIKFPIEAEYMPGSTSVRLFGLDSIKTNGKGTNLANARASAYSEFMERLQNNILVDFDLKSEEFAFAPDEHLSIKPDLTKLYDYYDAKCLNAISKIENVNDLCIALPFYSLKDKSKYYFPIEILFSLQGSNGMCAGNTPEEALVQGLSEVYERYSLKKVIKDKISMPDIPEEVWGKYERIKNLKDYIEQYDFEITIKDASLGENLPVICTLFRNKKDNTYNFTFGAQPSLPIAIERTLTEFTQGGLKNYETNKVPLDETTTTIDRTYLFDYCADVAGAIIKPEQDRELHAQFFENKPDYEFSQNAWVDENVTYSNKNLLEFLMTNVKAVLEKDVYVRDVSYLGFPSFYIFIPGMSEFRLREVERLNREYDFEKWKFYTGDRCNENRDINSLISALEFKVNYLDNRTFYDLISPLADEYLLLLCHIAKGDFETAVKYCDVILNTDKIKKYDNRFEIMKEYLSLLNDKKSEEEINIVLNAKYPKEQIDSLKMFVSHINFVQIKQIINDSNERYFARKEKENVQIMQKITENENLIAEKYGDLEGNLENVKKKLINKYLNNIPNQSDLEKVFDFIK